MTAGNNHHTAGLPTLVARVARVALKAAQTRAELLAVEWQEERLRAVDLLACSLALLLLGTLGLLFLSVTIIFLFPAGVRIYVAAGFAALYLLAAGGVWIALRSILKRQPFSESIEQVKKDRLWLESLK